MAKSLVISSLQIADKCKFQNIHIANKSNFHVNVDFFTFFSHYDLYVYYVLLHYDYYIMITILSGRDRNRLNSLCTTK